MPYDELRATSVDLAGRFAPELLELLSATLAVKLGPASARERAQMVRRFQRTLLGMRGYVLGLELVAGDLPAALARYAFLEGVTREQLKAAGQKLHDEEDACLVLLSRLRKGASSSPAADRMPGYPQARAAVDALVNELAPHARKEAFSAIAKTWSASDEAKKVIQFGQRLPTLSRGWRRIKPKRLTQQLVAQLTNQYRDCATVFEQCLRRLVAFDRVARGSTERWRMFAEATLAKLLAMAMAAEASPHLRVIAQGINRQVRNVLAHGHATLSVRTNKVEFCGKGRVLVSWTPAEFFDATWTLTANVLAMLTFDQQLSLVTSTTIIEHLAAQAKADRPPSAWWTPARAQIRRWLAQHSDALAELYVGAVRLLDGPADVASRLRFIAHAVREIRNRLPDAVAPGERIRFRYEEIVGQLNQSLEGFNWGTVDADPKPLPSLSQDLLRQLLDEHDAVKETNVDAAQRLFRTATRSGQGETLRPLAREWHELGEWFMHDVHVGTKGTAGRPDGEYRERFRRFEAILATLGADFFTPIVKLDAVLGDPTSSLADALVHLGHDEQITYFFDKLDRPDWVTGLQKKQFFLVPPDPVVEDDGKYSRFPRWPALKFLVRVAGRAPDAVLDAAASITKTNTKNLSVYGDLLDVALQLPPHHAAKLTRKLLPGLRGGKRLHALIEHRLQPLIGHLAAGGEAASAEELLVVAARFSAGETSYGPPVTRMPVWTLEQLFRHNVGCLLTADARRFFARFIALLREAVKCGLASSEAKARLDSSTVWRKAIEASAGHVVDPRAVLVDAVRDAALWLATSAESLRDVLAQLEDEHFPIFKRIALHVALERVALARDEAVARVMKPNLFDDPDLKREYARLLAVTYAELTTDQKETVLEWIENGPDLTYLEAHYVQTEGAPSLEERKRERRERWQLAKLALISDGLGNDWRNRYEKLLEEYGPPDDPRTYSQREAWVGPTSPFKDEELLALDVDALVKKVRDWLPASGWMIPSPAGLGRQLAQIVAANPHIYAATEKFTVLEPTYVRSVIDGFHAALSAGREIPWDGALGLLESVLRHAFEADGGDALERDVGWRWARSSAARLMNDAFVRTFRLPYGFRARAWAIIESLLRDPDPSVEDEESQIGGGSDVGDIAVNATRSVALEAALRYVAWVRDHLGTEAVTSFRSMPEVRGALERHLNSMNEKSRAIRFLYGRWFRLLMAVDKAWTRDHLTKIFGAPTDAGVLGATAWGAFVSSSVSDKDGYDLLGPYYGRAVERIGKGPPTARRLNSPDEMLTHHLARLYWSGVIELDATGSPLRRFYDVAHVDLRAHLASFVGRALHGTKESELPAQAAERLRAFWSARLDALGARPPAERNGELAAFGWWFTAGNLGTAWLLQRLRTGLEMHASVDPSTLVVERLAAVAPDHTLAALECLKLMVHGDTTGWNVESWKNNAMTLLRVALANSETFECATKLVNELGRRGFHDYRALLEGDQPPPGAD